MIKSKQYIKHLFASQAHIFIAILLIFQPILDIISFWFDKCGLSPNITLALRLFVLAVTVIYAFVVSANKKVFYIAAGILSLLYIGHLFACFQAGGPFNLFSDISNYIRVIQTPLLVISLISLLKANENSYKGLQYGISIAFLIMLAVMLISTITGTDPHTYKDGKGVLGWFNNTNSQSSNLTVLLPISLAWQLTWKNFKTFKNQLIFWCTCVFGLIAMYVFCTRLAYLGIIAATFGIAVCFLLIRSKNWIAAIKEKSFKKIVSETFTPVILFVLCAIFVILIPVSPMTKHINNEYDYTNNTVQKWANDKVEDLDEVEELKEQEKDEEKTEEEKEELEAKLAEKLEKLYTWKMADFVEIFGLEKTMEMYDYTTDVNAFTDLRAKKITFGKMLMEASPFTSQLFGLEISRFTVETEQEVVVSEGVTEIQTVTNVYDVENDFHGIYFLYGWVGLAAYALFILYFVYIILVALIKNFKKYFTLEAVGFGIAFLMCMAHAYNTAGVLRRPNASVFLAATLAGIYYLIKIKKYNNEN